VISFELKKTPTEIRPQSPIFLIRRREMAEPITLAVVGAVVLTEGVKFLYNQCGEVLKRWRDRRDAAKKGDAANPEAKQPKPVEPITIAAPDIFTGRLTSPQIHYDAVEKLEEPMRDLRKELSSYADGTDPIDTSDEELLKKTDALRCILEAVYQQRLTFKGEQRPSSGPVVEGSIDVDNVKGYVAAVRAKTILGGHVRADVKAKNSEAGSQIVGVEVDTIGGNPRPDSD
jgi:hypothetical protein